PGDVTVAVLVTCVPPAVLELVFTTSVNVAVAVAVSELPATSVQLTSPLVGPDEDHPAGQLQLTKVVPEGTLSETVTFVASLGPVFVAVIVYANCAPG